MWTRRRAAETRHMVPDAIYTANGNAAALPLPLMGPAVERLVGIVPYEGCSKATRVSHDKARHDSGFTGGGAVPTRGLRKYSRTPTPSSSARVNSFTSGPAHTHPARDQRAGRGRRTRAAATQTHDLSTYSTVAPCEHTMSQSPSVKNRSSPPPEKNPREVTSHTRPIIYI